MAKKSVTFRAVKYMYITVLLLGLIGSTLLFIVGLYSLSDSEDNSNFYENIMKYYGIDDLNFEPIFNDTNLSLNNSNNSYVHQKQNFLGTIMVFVGIVSVIFELIGLIGAIRQNLVITLTILVLMIVGTVSGLFTIKTIDLCTVITQLVFIVLAALYVFLLKKDMNAGVRGTGGGANTYNPDVEMNRSGGQKRETLEKYITLNSVSPPYKDVDIHNKNII